MAASVDTEEVVKMSIKESEVTFPVGYGVDPASVSELTGAFYQEDPGKREGPFLHTTDFLLHPDGRVNIAVYSTGPLGRLVWQDVVPAVQFRKKKMAAQKK